MLISSNYNSLYNEDANIPKGLIIKNKNEYKTWAIFYKVAI